MTKKKVLIVHGPNLNLLGKREENIYGNFTLYQLTSHLKKYSKEYDMELKFFQSNHEGKIIDFIQERLSNHFGLIINAGALTHTSLALRDCLQVFEGLIYEVHISNIYAREFYRRQSYISEVSDSVICGLGITGYEIAVEAMNKK
tara:strand:+ start:314 stop:748 length:435 start_codon:yes stop_codon:yes gene_type:complete